MPKTKSDPIRKLLAGCAPSMFLGNPKGTIAIYEYRVVDAGGDADKVYQWVLDHGGERDRSFPVKGQQAHGVLRPRDPSKRFYIIPEDALT